MTTGISRCVLLSGAAMALAGCASVSQNEAFQGAADVTASTGQHVVWNQTTADDAKAQQAVLAILAHPMTANDAVRVALLNSPEIQADFEEIGISQADLVQAGLLQNPTFSASWRFPNRPPGFTDAEYSVAEDFLGAVLIPLRTKIAKANLEAIEDRVTNDVVRYVAEVKTAVYELQAQEQLRGRYQLIVDANQASANLADAQHKAGNISDADYASQEVQFANARLYLTESERQRIDNREKLNRLMGLWGQATAWQVVPKLPNLPAKEGSLSHLESLAISQRRDFRAARQEVDSLGQALALQTNTRYLPASVKIGGDTESDPDGPGGLRLTGPTLDLELPIFDQGEGTVAKLAAQYRQAERKLQNQAIAIRSEVRQAVEDLKMDRDLTLYYQKVVMPLNVQVANQSLLQFNAMQKNAFDLLQAKQNELGAERDYVEAWRDYWTAHAQLEQAVGGRLRTFSTSQP
jgi:outer membrane protein, heavy metal efflux system